MLTIHLQTDSTILITGAAGFIGAHIVDEFLRRGYRVRGTTRSAEKAEEMRRSRPHAGDRVEFVVTGDLTEPNVFDEVVKGVDGIIHVAGVCFIPAWTLCTF